MTAEDDDEGYIEMTPDVQIPSAIAIAVVITLAVVGNVFTVVAYVSDRRLSAVYDFYMASLAVTDLLIGAISMPVYAYYTLAGFYWPLGAPICKAFLACDFTFCFQSILLMLVLSLDRLLLLISGPYYMNKVTRRRAAWVVAVTWAVSALLYVPAIVGWDYWTGQSTVEYMDCDVEFAHNVPFTMATAFIEFFLALVALIVLNGLIYFKIRRRLKLGNNHVATHISLTKAVQSTSNAFSSQATEIAVTRTRKTSVSGNNRSPERPTADGAGLSYEQDRGYLNKNTVPVPTCVFTVSQQRKNKEQLGNRITNAVYELESRNQSGDCTQQSPKAPHGCDEKRSLENEHHKLANTLSTSTASHLITNPSNLGGMDNKNNMHRARREAKAARFLASLVVVFLVTWCPYTVSTVVISFCQTCVNMSVYELLNWVLWTKSAVNPFLYAANSSRYRGHFRRYLLCFRGRVGPGPTSSNYYSHR